MVCLPSRQANLPSTGWYRAARAGSSPLIAPQAARAGSRASASTVAARWLHIAQEALIVRLQAPGSNPEMQQVAFSIDMRLTEALGRRKTRWKVGAAEEDAQGLRAGRTVCDQLWRCSALWRPARTHACGHAASRRLHFCCGPSTCTGEQGRVGCSMLTQEFWQRVRAATRQSSHTLPARRLRPAPARYTSAPRTPARRLRRPLFLLQHERGGL